MKFQNILIPVVGLVVLGVAWQNYGFGGVALVGGGLVMWGLLHVTRMMQVMKRAADRPIGHVASAVMLNAKLKPGVNLLHVMALTRALGDLRSPKDTQPEVYRWTDTGGSYVDVTLHDGKVTQWQLTRPPQADAPAEGPGSATPAP
ncbi:hypothetical protein [Pseudorhodoferax sp. Leaf267]|uniref:hypothetical protein n=1 Tax=Pseudorhodoferax sp. Leaf267 TaxID=1736316 RepID=UPI0006FE996A|nr:hypothetical protein [Pseudorhodoferax sp. Leaf267]KQP11816.1 glycerate kinase [Pseudorhodoferax sp. Leaf267]